MTFRLTLGALLAAMAALLVAFASPALAKGGGGGGGGGGTTVVAAPCATVNTWDPTVVTLNGRPVVVVHVGVFSSCLDEGKGAQPPLAVAMTATDTATGAWLSADVKMGGVGQSTYDFSVGTLTATPPAKTMTLTVTRSNGQLQYSRSMTLADLYLAAQAAA